MSLNAIMEKEARLVILRTLAEQPDMRLNSSLLREDLAERWGINRSRDWVHEQLRFLSAEVHAVSVESVGSVQIAAITARGLDHVEGRVVLNNVRRPSPQDV